MKARRPEWFSRSLEYFFSLRSAKILQRVFLKEQIRESSNPECETPDFWVKKRPAS